MGRPRKWESDAERKRAARQPISEVSLETLEAESLIESAMKSPTISKADYVTREVEITRRQMAAGALKEATDTKGRGRLQRCEAYARWRWEAFHRGEVASL